ncbi:MAG: chorismate lyase [Rhodocyclaceae bacterium]|jgi:chorismate--pyruvate lyase|nr:chorismate lyase [Rhodocyclaceae bacterium]
MSEYFRKLRGPDAGGWQPQARAAGALRSWLDERRSLSARIAAACPVAEPFNLKLLFSGCATATRDEAVLVGARRGECMRVREVQLCAGATPLVFAHSVTHPRHLLGPWRLMGRLGGGVLGSVLFRDPSIRRGALAFRALDSRHPLYRHMERVYGRLPKRLWARRAVFRHKGKPLLVTEVFLPSLSELL